MIDEKRLNRFWISWLEDDDDQECGSPVPGAYCSGHGEGYRTICWLVDAESNKDAFRAAERLAGPLYREARFDSDPAEIGPVAVTHPGLVESGRWANLIATRASDCWFHLEDGSGYHPLKCSIWKSPLGSSEAVCDHDVV